MISNLLHKFRLWKLRSSLEFMDKVLKNNPQRRERLLIESKWELYKNPSFQAACKVIFLTERSYDMEAMLDRAEALYNESQHYYNIEHGIPND